MLTNTTAIYLERNKLCFFYCHDQEILSLISHQAILITPTWVTEKTECPYMPFM